jgi:hypothetical protein
MHQANKSDPNLLYPVCFQIALQGEQGTHRGRTYIRVHASKWRSHTPCIYIRVHAYPLIVAQAAYLFIFTVASCRSDKMAYLCDNIYIARLEHGAI